METGHPSTRPLTRVVETGLYWTAVNVLSVVGVLFIIAAGLSVALCISVVVARRILDPKGSENLEKFNMSI